MNHAKILNCLNVMNDTLRQLARVDQPLLIRAFCLAYDEAYQELIASLSHPEPKATQDMLPALNLCQHCKELKN